MKKLFVILATLIVLILPKAIHAIDVEGPYVTFAGGINFLNITQHPVKPYFQMGPFGALSAGYRYCEGFRLEAQGTYRRNVLKSVKPHHQSSLHRKGHVFTWSIMANGIMELPFELPLTTPYIGAGIGYDNGQKRVCFKKTVNGFAWQFMTGILHQIDDNMELGLEYLFHPGHEHRTYNNTANLKLNWFF